MHNRAIDVQESLPCHSLRRSHSTRVHPDVFASSHRSSSLSDWRLRASPRASCSADGLPPAGSPMDLRRVAVVGTSCAGKTTFAKALAAQLQAPHIELDALHHGPGWVPRPEFLAGLRVGRGVHDFGVCEVCSQESGTLTVCNGVTQNFCYVAKRAFAQERVSHWDR